MSNHIHRRGMQGREGHGNGLTCVIAYIGAKTGSQTASDYTHTSSVNFNPCKRKDWDKRMVLRVEVQSTQGRVTEVAEQGWGE